ncbi:hypothetical protein LF41_2959 [Lysobacter dokdonensis DS-58]|uniref:Transmembrane protein n=1 Tax=Lysobacter dokdonensis DS-58 TaxID=1300345 RepID=A0A0A2WGJ9_9GAMM|nr:hypothetical protein [Lysobacter dokdonensis]KGQ19311.1 hypothetical protein LF41_2959 [Lysobacter dokdonensis DS-58]
MSEVVARQPNTAAKAAWICLVIAWVTFLLPVPFIGMLGWALNLVAFILAIVAMNKGGAMSGLFQLLASLLVSPFVYLIGVILFLGTLDSAPDWSEMMRDHASFSSSGNNAAEEANRAAGEADIAAIEAMADAASGAPPAQASVSVPASASTR